MTTAPTRGSGLLSVERARDLVLAAIPGPLAAQDVSTDGALGRVLAAPVIAATDLPPWDNSAMDGYALRAADTVAATESAPVRLAVVGDVAAGAAPTVTVTPGVAVRIATGAPLPPGADAVVPVEETTPLDQADVPGPRGRDATGPLPAACLVHVAVRPGGSVRRAGDDLRAGTVVLEPGTALTPAGIAIAAGSGTGRLTVTRRPRVAVLATGDEVRPTGTALGPAGIPDANGPGLAALVADAGGHPIRLGVARDILDDVLGRLRTAIADGADAIIVSGGVSVGPYDVVKLAFDALGRIDLWRVAVQPGKPFAFGTAERPGGGPPILLFGLPGNPVSGFVTFELFVRPALRRLAGRRDLLRPTDRAVLAEPVSKSHGRRAFLRVVSGERDERGRVRVRLAGGQGSHVLSALAAANALAVVPEDVDELPADAEVELWWLDRA
ncbi:MAG TPA: gephyrin-like molybdotransferase Glp [Candidatus Limnocylindrales bacterium]|nr:gephyrin-like molybdotransferase Glp [Candidatus Limnocylindrales bacterium]